MGQICKYLHIQVTLSSLEQGWGVLRGPVCTQNVMVQILLGSGFANAREVHLQINIHMPSKMASK